VVKNVAVQYLARFSTWLKSGMFQPLSRELKFKRGFGEEQCDEKYPVEENQVRNLSQMIPATVEAVRNTRIAAARSSIATTFILFSL